MWIWKNRSSPQPSQASPPGSDRALPQAFLLRLLRLFHAGGLHRRAGEAPHGYLVMTAELPGSLVKVVVPEQAESLVQNSAGTPGEMLLLRPLRYRPESAYLRALPPPVCQLSHHQRFLRTMEWIITPRLSWEGGLPRS